MRNALLYGLFMLEDYEAIIPFLSRAFDRAIEMRQLSFLNYIGTRLHNLKAVRLVLEHMIESELWQTRNILEEFGTIRGYRLWKPAAENIALFTDPSYFPTTRQSACTILGYLKMRISRDALRRVLREDVDGRVRAAAALGLGRLHDLDSRETIIAHLQAENCTNHDFAMALAYLGDKRSVRFLREHALLPGEERRNNNTVLEALASVKSDAKSEIGHFLFTLFKQKRASTSVLKHELIELTIWMIKADAPEFKKAFKILRDDPAFRDEFTKSLPQILRTLGEYGGKKYLPLVEGYFYHDSFDVRKEADFAAFCFHERAK